MNRTIPPALMSHARKAIAATSNAVAAANDPKRAASPPASCPKVDPSSNETADVTVTTVCRELQNNQNTRPEKRQA